jgi:hypothetical protein
MPKELDIYKRDNLLVELLFKSKGSQNILSRRDIARYLTENGFKTNELTVNTLVKKVRLERHLPICHLNSKGYFWASTSKEIKDSIVDLENRIAAMNENIEFLKSFIFE